MVAFHLSVLAIIALAKIYAIIRYNHWADYNWFRLPIQVTNKTGV
jgi:hypothetical protein